MKESQNPNPFSMLSQFMNSLSDSGNLDLILSLKTIMPFHESLMNQEPETNEDSNTTNENQP